MTKTKNNSNHNKNNINNTITPEQHQKIMDNLKKERDKANATVIKLEAKIKKDRQKAEAKLVRERAEFNKQREKDQKIIDKRVAKFDADRAKETRMKLKKETTIWERESRVELERRKEYLGWKGQDMKTRKKRQVLGNKLAKIYKKDEKLKPRLTDEAIRRNTSKWFVSGGRFKDPITFLRAGTPWVNRTTNSINSVGKKVNTVLLVEMIRTDPETGEDIITVAHFRSNTHSIISAKDSETEYEIMKERMLELLSEYQKLGSGWRILRIEGLEIFITKYRPLNGRSYKPLPKAIKSKKAVINMENDDNKCFMWAVTRGRNPAGRDNKNPGRISKILRKQTEKLDWEGVVFPAEWENIDGFEEKKCFNIHILSYDDELKKVYTLRLGKLDTDECVILFLYNNHYSVVKDLSRLVSSQLSKNEHKKYICLRCLNSFGSTKILDEHTELCKNHDHQRHVYPTDKNRIISFEKCHRMNRVPFVVYADFESFIEPIHTVEGNPGKSYTARYQKHIPSGFCYTIKCTNENIYKGKTVLYTATEEGEDIGKKFVECLEKDIQVINKILENDVPIKMTKDDYDNYKNIKDCSACGLKLGRDRTKDYCRLTGKYRGTVHEKCKSKTGTPKFIPVLFHNLEGYDSHLFVKSLGFSEGGIKCIPKTDEKYISFSKNVVVGKYTDQDGNEKDRTLEIRFLDSLKFTLISLDSLVKNLGKNQFNILEKEMGTNNLLKKKGVFPYEYMTGYDKLQESKLPPKKEFYSKLNNVGISDDEYSHAQEVWNTFGCKTMRD